MQTLSTPQMEDPELHLMERTARGDSAAFDELVRQHYPRALAVALEYTANPAYAPDVVIESFAKAFQAAPRFRGDCRFSTWIHRIVRNTAFDFNERVNRPPTVTFDEAWTVLPATDRYGNPRPLSAIEDFEVDTEPAAQNEVASAFHRLSAKDQELLRMHYNQELSYETLAQRFGVALGTVKSRLHRARLHLRTKLL